MIYYKMSIDAVFPLLWKQRADGGQAGGEKRERCSLSSPCWVVLENSKE